MIRHAMIMALIAAIGAMSSSNVEGQGTPRPAAAPPLALQASCRGEGQGATLRILLQNRSDRDVAIVLGKLVGSTRTQVIDSLFVMAIRLATGANEEFMYVNPKHATLDGRTEPWIVQLAAGGTYDIEAPVVHFISRLNFSLLDPFAIAGTRLILDARPGSANNPATKGRPVWTGQVEVPLDACS